MTRPTCRIGLGLGASKVVHDPSGLRACAIALESKGFDSLWTSDVVSAPSLDPLAALSFVAAITTRLRLGTSVLVVPGRLPTRLAKELASIDVLSDGRFLPMLGLGVIEDVATGGLGVARVDRGPLVEEVVPLLRRLWAEESVDHAGPRHRLVDFRPSVRPIRSTLPIWFGGRSRSELERAGRLADGWLASFATPEEVRASITVVTEAAAEADRRIDADHYGALVPYALSGNSKSLATLMSWRRPDVRADRVAPCSGEALAAHIEAMLDAGASKFVLTPVDEPPDWDDHLGELAAVCASFDDRISASPAG